MTNPLRGTDQILSLTFQAAGGRKEAAQRFGVSRDMINRWCEPMDGSGKLNPIERAKRVVEMQVLSGEIHLAKETIEEIAAALKAVGCSVLFLNPEETKTLGRMLR